MTAPTPTRAECIAQARAVLDAARRRRDLDRVAGRLNPEAELILRRLERSQSQPAPARRAAA
ncbi:MULTISPECIES: hypothetical protein [Streptomyces]|uniref:hypothetical protein n=1 Tax=Streptomyces TaxID=1883 RepID=UPI0036FD165F